MQHFLIRKSCYASCLHLYIDKMHRAAGCTGLDTQGVRMHNPDNRAPWRCVKRFHQSWWGRLMVQLWKSRTWIQWFRRHRYGDYKYIKAVVWVIRQVEYHFEDAEAWRFSWWLFLGFLIALSSMASGSGPPKWCFCFLDGSSASSFPISEELIVTPVTMKDR